jgi:hypothetical protein
MMQDVSPPKKKTDIKVIALAIICVILAAGLVGVIAVYQPTEQANKEAQIADLQAQVASLTQKLAAASDTSAYTTQIASLRQQISALESDLSSANSTITTIYAEQTEYQQIINLQKTSTLNDESLTQDANSTTEYWSGNLLYAGYFTVEIESNSTTTFAQIIYSFGDIDFNYNQTVGKSGTALFAVLPTETHLIIGNLEQTDATAINATATIHY